MIIDDENYSLKGYQVKELVEKVKESDAAFKPFPDSVVTDGTTEQFMNSILALGVPVGTAFLGTVSLSDLPAGLVQEEVAVYVYSDYVVYCDVKSTDVAPYEWWCASYNYQGWRPVNTDTTYSAGTGLELTGTQFSIDSTVALKTEIPTVNNATLTIQKNSTSAGTFTANSATDTTINLTVPTTAAEVSALPDSTKYGASITVAINTTDYKMTTTLKDQDGNTLGSAQVVDLPLESVVVNGSYDSLTKEVVLTLQNGNTIRFSVADLVSGLQTEITSSNKLSADLVDDSTTTNKFVTATDKTTWSGKQNALTAGSNITISGDTISATDTTYSDFVGATSGDAGAHGLVPAPASGDTDKYLKSDGSWATVSQYSLPAATANILGGVKIGSNLSMDANDVLSATDTTYTAGTNVSISSGNVISATDTTYSNFVGTDGTAAGTAGLVPAPATTDAGKFLSASGSWITPDAGIKTLTTADYNWPTTGAKTAIAPWLLEPGYYKTDEPIKFKIVPSGQNTQYVPAGPLFVGKADNSNVVSFVQLSVRDSGYPRMLYYNASTGTAIPQIDTFSGGELVRTSDVIDNLTSSTKSWLPLSASQGYVLNDKIEGRLKTNAGAPTTSTTGTKGQLLEDTTNGNLYICTNSASPYAWKQIDKDEILTNAGAPTTSTAGTLGQLLTDTTNAKLYQLTAIDTTDPQNIVYTWTEVGGGSGPTVVQTTGTSTTDVMSQKAVTSMVFRDPVDKDGVQIGKNSNISSYSDSVAIGKTAQVSGNAGVAIGSYAGGSSSPKGSISLGSYAKASKQGQMNIGLGNATTTLLAQYGYNGTAYRLLSGLYDPQTAHDAATKGYADTKATITMTTTDPGEGAATTANTLTAVYS